MLICDRLKFARKENKLTQQQVAELLGVDRSTYAYYELGVSNPSIESLIEMSVIFNVDIKWLIGADRQDDELSSPEADYILMKAVREKQITDLSKDERQLVALYRLAGIYGKREELVDAVRQFTIEKDDDE